MQEGISATRHTVIKDYKVNTNKPCVEDVYKQTYEDVGVDSPLCPIIKAMIALTSQQPGVPSPDDSYKLGAESKGSLSAFCFFTPLITLNAEGGTVASMWEANYPSTVSKRHTDSSEIAIVA